MQAVNVLDTYCVGEQVTHRVDAPLEEGITVHGILDWENRLDDMQGHSGEHILIGLTAAGTPYQVNRRWVNSYR